jgi:hypothetical protein
MIGKVNAKYYHEQTLLCQNKTSTERVDDLEVEAKILSMWKVFVDAPLASGEDNAPTEIDLYSWPSETARLCQSKKLKQIDSA